MTKKEVLEMLDRNNRENLAAITETITIIQFKDKKIAELFINKIIENCAFYQIYGGTNYAKKDNGDRFNEVYDIIGKYDFSDIKYLKIEKFKILIKDMELTEKDFLIKILNYKQEFGFFEKNKEKYLKLANEIIEIILSLEYNYNNYIKFKLFLDVIYDTEGWYLNKKLWDEEMLKKLKNKKTYFSEFLLKLKHF